MFANVTEAPFVAVDYVNDTDRERDITYASATAPGACFVTVSVTRSRTKEARGARGATDVVDGVHVAAGGSHSWWSGAHGKLLARGLAPGERLRVSGTAPFAFRWDWSDE